MIDWKKFVAVALAQDKEVFVVHMAHLKSNMPIYVA